jgi:hypothetical protein
MVSLRFQTVSETAMIKATRMLADLLRSHAGLQADVQTLGALLQRLEDFQVPPEHWGVVLKEARETPEYQSISQQYDSGIVQLEQAADFHEVLQVLETMPETRVKH